MARPALPDEIRKRVMDAYGGYCIYCDGIATVVDHIIPWSWTMRHDFSNLVPSCNDCNSIASDKLFRSFSAKRTYILNKRGLPKWHNRFLNRRSICTDCGLPYKPRVKGSTVFLCLHCADLATKDPCVREEEIKKWNIKVRQYKVDELAAIEREVELARNKVRMDCIKDILNS